jgi:hydroxymethylglutaryl-CoA lyase
MSNLPGSVRIMECGPRDGLQIEAKLLSVSEKVELITALVSTGIKEIEVGSLVRPDAVPQMANTGEVIDQLPPAPAGVSYRVAYLNSRGLNRAKQHSNKIALDGRIGITASESFVKRNTNRTIDESFADIPVWIDLYRSAGVTVDTLGVMAAFGCNFEGVVPEERVIGMIQRAERIFEAQGGKLRRLSLMDTMGWANPNSIKSLVGKVQDQWPEIQVDLHLHDTRGLAIANATAGLQMGVANFDGSIGGLGGCPFAGNIMADGRGKVYQGAVGNICTEDFVFLCHEMGIETGIDLEALIEVARLAESLVERPLPGKVMKSGTLQSKRDRARLQAADEGGCDKSTFPHRPAEIATGGETSM